MKRILSILLLIVLVVAAALFLRTIYERDQATKTGNAMAIDITTDALRSWNASLIIDNADGSLLNATQPEVFHTLFRALSRLGLLQELTGIAYEMTQPSFWQFSGTASANYTMQARFENGFAEIRISMIRKNGQWYFTNYQVLTPLLNA